MSQERSDNCGGSENTGCTLTYREKQQRSYTAAVDKSSAIEGRTGQKEIGIGVRGAIIGLHRTGLPYLDIAKVVGNVSERTVSKIVKDTITRAEANAENKDTLADENLKIPKRPGRPKKFSEEQKSAVVTLATRNREQRRKSFTQLARECEFEISRQSLAAILAEQGYSRCIARRKPRIVPENQEKRLRFSRKHDNQEVVGFWDGWIWTDEMSRKVGKHYGLDLVIRNPEEEYHEDCLTEERQGDVTIMFWAAIIYGIPCAECPYHVWTIETEAEKEEAKEQIAEWNTKIDRLNAETYEKLKTINRELPKGQRRRGRLPNPDRIRKKSRSTRRKGGIDCYRYQKEICEPLLYPFYDKMKASHARGERGPVVLMEDGAGPHRCESLNSFRHQRGINKIDWPACKFLSLLLPKSPKRPSLTSLPH
jgi:transposase